MEKYSVRTLEKNQGKYGQAVSFLNMNFILLSMFSLLLGRASILDGLMPFGIAFFASLISKEKKNILISFFVIIGILTTGGADKYKYVIDILLIYVTIRYFIGANKFNVFKTSLITAVISFLVGSIYLVITDFYLYDLFMVCFESIVVFVFMYIVSYALPVMTIRSNRRILSNEETICLAIVAAVAVLGLSNLIIYEYSLKNVIALLVILLFAYNGGASIGAGVGVTIGVITSMSTIGTPLLVGIYSFSGLLAGLFKDIGKIASAIGLVLGNSILTFYINGFSETIIQFEEVIIAFFVFLLLPKRMTENLSKFINSKVSIDKFDRVYSDRMKRIVLRQLDEYSEAFSELAATYSKIADKEKIVEHREITEIVDKIANSTCSVCSLKRNCWKNNFYSTYNSIIDAITILETQGILDEDNLPTYLKKRCIKPKELLNIINSSFQVYKVNYKWNKKMFEMRQLVSEQFEGVSDIINDLTKDISTNIDFKKDVEDALYVAFDKERIVVDNVTVMENRDGKFQIDIEKSNCYNRNSCEKRIIPIVSEIVGLNLINKNKRCRINDANDKCIIQLIEAQKFKANTGVAKVSKEIGHISGDNYTFMELKENKYMVALSDGMGSGEKAARESMATITLLENLMEAGFNKNITLKTINSVLMSKSLDEAFATIDLSIIDLYSARGEFIKIGAAPTFIKRADGEVEVLEASSLPAGIINEIALESKSIKLKQGDYIIIMSDGILDVDKNFINKTNWMVDIIKNIKTRNPQTIADEILNTSLKRSGNNVEDDMTVLVTKVWKRPSA